MTPTRNLVLVHQPGRQDIADFGHIAARLAQLAPDIATFIVSNESRSFVSRKAASGRPTLVVSPGPLDAFRPVRGKVYAGFPMPKDEQLRRLGAAGVPVPEWRLLTPGLVLPDAFGPYVVLKPVSIHASSSRDMELARRENARHRRPDLYPQNHLARTSPVIAQRFVRTGAHVSHVRVLTLFGEPLYAFRTRALAPLPDLDRLSRAELASTLILAKPGVRRLTIIHDPDILAFARRTAAAIPEVPQQGIDIIREEGTGQLYALEVNPGGNTWSLSDSGAANHREELGVPDLSVFFDTWTAAARVLADKTRAEAA